MTDAITPLDRNDPRIEKLLTEKTLCAVGAMAVTILADRETDVNCVALLFEDGDYPDHVALFRTLTADEARIMADQLRALADRVDAANVGVTGRLH